MPKSTQKPNKNLTFAQRTAQTEAKENVWQQYNSMAEFHAKDMVKSLEELAQKTFPTDSFNSNAYQEAIIESLTQTISPEVGIKDFWQAMAKAGCEKLQIENGHLSFYNGKGEKMDITSFTQPIVFEAHSSFYHQRQMEREKRIMEAKLQLKQLLKEIHKK